MQTTIERPALNAGAISSTRRRFLSMLGGLTAGSAALSVTVIQSDPAVAVPASKVASGASDELQALGEDLRNCYRAWADAGDHLRDVVEGLRRWEQENPEPRPYDDEGNKLPPGRWGVWNEEHKKALKRYGKLKALNLHQKTAIDHWVAVSEVVAFQAVTMPDLLLKAELSLEADTDSGHIASSVVEDLLDMTTEKSA